MKQALSDPDNVHVFICCAECRSDLWALKILSRFGAKVGSTEYRPLDKDVPKFSERIGECPKCGKRYYHVGATGTHQYMVRDVETGQIFMI